MEGGAFLSASPHCKVVFTRIFVGESAARDLGAACVLPRYGFLVFRDGGSLCIVNQVCLSQRWVLLGGEDGGRGGAGWRKKRKRGGEREIVPDLTFLRDAFRSQRGRRCCTAETPPAPRSTEVPRGCPAGCLLESLLLLFFTFLNSKAPMRSGSDVLVAPLASTHPPQGEVTPGGGKESSKIHVFFLCRGAFI